MKGEEIEGGRGRVGIKEIKEEEMRVKERRGGREGGREGEGEGERERERWR